jgi:hypothetical protein
MDLMTRYFEDSLRIYAVCGDDDLSDDDARLLTYIHVKACESGKGIDYFDDPSEFDEKALGVMLGDTIIADTLVTQKGEIVSLGDGHASTVSREIFSLDEAFERDLGMERRISGELQLRLRLYRDKSYRDKMVTLYSSQIAPKIFSYDRTAVEQAFKNHRDKTANNDRALESMPEE